MASEVVLTRFDSLWLPVQVGGCWLAWPPSWVLKWSWLPLTPFGFLRCYSSKLRLHGKIAGKACGLLCLQKQSARFGKAAFATKNNISQGKLALQVAKVMRASCFLQSKIACKAGKKKHSGRFFGKAWKSCFCRGKSLPESGFGCWTVVMVVESGFSGCWSLVAESGCYGCWTLGCWIRFFWLLNLACWIRPLGCWTRRFCVKPWWSVVESGFVLDGNLSSTDHCTALLEIPAYATSGTKQT